MVLPTTTEKTGGLCMPCFNRDKAQAASEAATFERTLAEHHAITVDTSPDEEVFMQNCAVYCELDCCGFNALDLSDSQVRKSIEAIGIDTAKNALSSMRSHIRQIGDHLGLVKFRGFFESAPETRANYEKACATLERVIKEVEQDIPPNAGTAPQPQP